MDSDRDETGQREAQTTLAPGSWQTTARARWIGDSPSVVSLTTLATIVVICAILYVAQDLFLPLALGMLIAFILSPVVRGLRAMGLGDTLAVVLTVLAAGGLVAAFLLLMAFQLSQIGASLPQYQDNVLGKIDTILAAGADNRLVAHVQAMVADISARFDAQVETAPAGDETMKVEVVNQTSLRDWVTGVIVPALTPVVIFGLVFVVVVLALLERASLRDRLVQLLGGSNILSTSRLLSEAGDRVSTYLLAQLVVNIIYAVPIGLGLWLIGVPNALFFALVTLVLRFVPYIGTFVSAVLPLVMAFAVSPDWSLVLWTAALFLGVELITSNMIEPFFYGKRTGVSPLAVIVSAMFWTWLWGPMGLIIATPLTVCLVVIGHHVPGLRLFPILFGDQPVLPEPERLYDRLLAGRWFEFSETAAASTTQTYLADYYDRTVLPALALAQADQQAGLLSDQQADRIARAAWLLTEELETVVDDELSEGTHAPAEQAGAAGTTLVTNGRLDGVGHRLAVMGAQTPLDEAAARMLGQALRAEGAETVVLPLHAPLVRTLGDFVPQTLIVVTLDAAPTSAVGLRVRQARRRFPGIRIGVARWPGGDRPADKTSRGVSADFVASGMADVFAAAFAMAAAAEDPDSRVKARPVPARQGRATDR
jgi:predicted PurR-regulated permease PerM